MDDEVFCKRVKNVIINILTLCIIYQYEKEYGYSYTREDLIQYAKDKGILDEHFEIL